MDVVFLTNLAKTLKHVHEKHLQFNHLKLGTKEHRSTRKIGIRTGDSPLSRQAHTISFSRVTTDAS